MFREHFKVQFVGISTIASPPCSSRLMEDASVATEEREDAAPIIQFPFDPNLTECVLDLRALCGLPANSDEDAVCSFRALMMPKGKTVHVPNEPGCYATLGPWRTQIALSLVHFVASTKRKMELLLSFMDYGMLSKGMTGVFVMSLQLPLLKSRNVYEETPRITSIKDVCGFSHINPSAQPWCAMLKPALERQPMFTQFNISNAKDIVCSLKISLEARLKTIEERAKADISKMVADLGRQDKRASEKMKGKFESSLAATMAFFHELPPKKYDRSMSERILMVKPEMPHVEWLKTPVRKTMDGGTAKMVSTIAPICRPQFNAPTESQALPSTSSGATSHPNSLPDEHASSSLPEFPEPSDSENSEPPEIPDSPRSKRKRNIPSRLASECATFAKASKANGKKKAKPSKVRWE